jgi:uncharacterized membrane protein (DUF4010 family)
VGFLWSRIPDSNSGSVDREFESKNPLELRAAFLFGGLFLAMLVATQLVVTYVGRSGVFSLAALMGAMDVDPFVMGMVQSSKTASALPVAAVAILIAAASNNVAKGAYAFSLGGRKAGIWSAALLIGLALAGLTPILWLLR